MTSFTYRLEKESLMQHQIPRPPGFLKVQGTIILRSLGLILGYWITCRKTVPGSAEAIYTSSVQGLIAVVRGLILPVVTFSQRNIQSTKKYGKCQANEGRYQVCLPRNIRMAWQQAPE